MLQTIFFIQPYTQTRSHFDINYEKERRQPEFISIDEGAGKTFFKKDQLDDSKLVFEG